ncbi:MAG: DUF4236 domain-containing protein [Acidobacteria bacterium]|nr:DUF4236 domain-containing protein [Acidobacteriota bacterium]
MGFRFWRRMKIAPGVTLNLSRSGGSLSFGPRGAKFTVGPGGRRATVGIPGTGLFYTKKLGGKKGKDSGLNLGFFKRLITPNDEEALVDGCRELALGDEEKAFQTLKNAGHLADGAYLAGFLALKRKQLAEAERFLVSAAEKPNELGQVFGKYGISATMSLPITDELSAEAGPDVRGVFLGLVEVYQRQNRRKDAIKSLEALLKLEPDDVVIKLSLAELLMEAFPDDANIFRRIVRLAEGVENETAAHAALLLYKAKALYGLGLFQGARDTLTTALRRKKGRSEELLHALRYERALVYEKLGQTSRTRTELEKLYAEAPDFEDVAQRLGLQQ